MNRLVLLKLISGLPPHSARRALRAIVARDAADAPVTLEQFKAQAAAAFEKDMQPVCDAIVGALREGDVAALKGLRGLLPELLQEVNKAPALGDLLALQLGRTFMDGLSEAGRAREEAP